MKIISFSQVSISQLDLKNISFSSFLDMMRWFAAIIVFLGHLRNPLFISYGEISSYNKSLIINIWYFVTGLHAEAVVIFFVLSGYLVGGMAFCKFANRTFSLSKYAFDRIMRIYITFIPALILGFLLDIFGSKYFSNAGLYNGSQMMLATKIESMAYFDSNLKILNFVENLFMLQDIFFPVLG